MLPSIGDASRRLDAFCSFSWPSHAADAADPPDPLAQARSALQPGPVRRRDRRSRARSGSCRVRPTAPISSRRARISSGSGRAPRQTTSTNARERLRRVDPQRFTTRERVEFIVGLGEALFFDKAYGAAADVFESALDTSDGQSRDARERVLDWWATAVDRDAWPRPEIERQMAYQRIRGQMRDELAADAGSTTAAYWSAAAARAQGDLQAAWDAAQAGWVRATAHEGPRCSALRADLDRLVLQAIVPERARVLAQPADNLQQEWDEFKARWKNPQ